MKEHECTKRCLRWATDFGRRFYYCAKVKPIDVPTELLARSHPLVRDVFGDRLRELHEDLEVLAKRAALRVAFVDPLEQLELGRAA